MIPFNIPPYVGTELDYVKQAVDNKKICGDGTFTKKCHQWLEVAFKCQKALLTTSGTTALEMAAILCDLKPGDEVILPSFTFSTTATAFVLVGAKLVFVDIRPDTMNIDETKIEAAITDKTKVIMPVDLGGMPCAYDELFELVEAEDVKTLFQAKTEEQRKLGRILILSDSAHSIGAEYKGRKAGCLADVSVFSFHAVKNLTTAEGGAIMLNLPEPFDNEEVYRYLCTYTLHGQNKDALAKTKKGAWRYDVLVSGFKGNMTDIMASIGLVELSRYEDDTLHYRKCIYDQYTDAFTRYGWAELPIYETEDRKSSYHVYCLRVKGITEQQRDEIIQRIFDKDVSVNVHFQPLPLLSAFKNKGYKMEDYPVAYDNYCREISLPVWYGLSEEMVKTVIDAVICSVEEVLA